MVKPRGVNRRDEAAVLTVRVQPRASRNGISRMPDGSFKVRLTAPPVDNAANDALVRFLADRLDVSRSAVEIVSGRSSREKRVRIRGVDEADLRRVLNTDGK